MPCKSQKGALVLSVFPSAHMGFPEPQGSVRVSHTPLPVLAHEQRALSVSSPTAFQVSLQELYQSAMQILTTNWDLLPLPCLHWYHTSTNCTLPFVHNIHRESPEQHGFSVLFLAWFNILIFIIISSTLSATEGYFTNPNPKISSTIFCQQKWYFLFSCTAAHTIENVHSLPPA